MKKLSRLLEMCIKLPFGLLLYLFSREFRALVNAKMRGANDPVQTGEEVLAVLSGPNNQVVGGKS